MGSVIWWIRRDLRLRDNYALQAAIGSSRPVVPAFILDDRLICSPNAGEKRLAFLWAGLAQLQRDLETRGSGLVIRNGLPDRALVALAAEYGAGGVFAEADFSPFARRRDAVVAGQLPLHLIGGAGISHPEAVLKPDGTPYVVYTPYMRLWKSLNEPEDWLPLPAPARIESPENLTGLPVPSSPALPPETLFEPGESAAQRRLAAFTSGTNPGVYRYADSRNRLDQEGTAMLSPYLRFGMLSAREAALAAFRARQTAPDAEGRRGAETWLNELIWREFYISILYHFPDVLKQSFRPELSVIPWRNDKTEYAAWREGRTGYPVVDAAMRQLSATGWMHNRARMIAASFLVKDLLVDWRWGERWFMQNLVDGDPAANNGGWQWTAGTGTDAAPYFRIFNPVLQGKKFDPQGVYVRKWVPELSEVPLRWIHTPWELPLEEQKRIGCRIGADYPAPVIEHALARQLTLQAYQSSKSLAQG